MAKTKRRTPKTYQGNSKRTLHRREVARKVLASQGFHDVFTFMALKEKKISEQGPSNPGDGGLTNRSPASSLPGSIEPEEEGDRGHHDDGTLPSPVDRNRVRYGGVVDVGGESAAAPNPPPIAGPGLCSPVPSEPSPIRFPGRGRFIRVASDENERRTWAEEEESSREEETPSHLRRTCYWIVDADLDANESPSEPGGSENEPPELESRTGKGKERHWAAEEDEESSDESSKVVGVARYRDNKASCKDSSSEAHCHGVGSIEGWSAGAEDNSEGDGADDRGGHSPGPVPSRSPTVLSGRSSDFDLESEAADKPLEGWKDREALAKALPKLVEKARDLRLDLVLRARLTGMIGVLNLYLDSKLKSSWADASVIVAKIEGRGVNRARNLREWILSFVRSGELPVRHLGQSRWNILDDEDLSQSLQTLLLSHTKGRYITASDVVELVSGPVMQEKFTRSQISRASISERTARRWLQRLSWRYGAMRNGMYLDGHEREDVVAYRKAFVARWKDYEERFHTWDSDGVEHKAQNSESIQVKGGLFRLILVTHDESVFYQNDFRKTHWIANTSKATPLPKGDGQSIMVSDFLTVEWGRLLDMGPNGVLESVLILLRLTLY